MRVDYEWEGEGGVTKERKEGGRRCDQGKGAEGWGDQGEAQGRSRKGKSRPPSEPR